MTTLIDGRMVAGDLLDRLKGRLELLEKQNIKPKLVIVLVGNDPASISYIRQKNKACEKVGIECEQINLEETVTTEELINLVNSFNQDNSVHGILVQLPLPEHVDAPKVMKAIAAQKDVDGFTAYNLGKTFLSAEFEHLPPCTPKGVIKMLEHYQVEMAGKEAVVVGASNIVGKPMSVMLLNRGATVTTCHILTKDLKFHTSRADILVVAVGKAGLITADMVKEGAVVVDIGINKVDGKLCGDVDFEEVSKKTKMITPVPGGAGPMTVACLIENTIVAAERINHLDH